MCCFLVLKQAKHYIRYMVSFVMLWCFVMFDVFSVLCVVVFGSVFHLLGFIVCWVVVLLLFVVCCCLCHVMYVVLLFLFYICVVVLFMCFCCLCFCIVLCCVVVSVCVVLI